MIIHHSLTTHSLAHSLYVGINPNDAVDRLARFKEEFKIRQRKTESYNGGEELFALPITAYPDIVQTEKELKLADQLFALYVDVLGMFYSYIFICFYTCVCMSMTVYYHRYPCILLLILTYVH